MSEQISTLIEKTLRDIPETDWEQINNSESSVITRFMTGSPPEVAVDIEDSEILVLRWAAQWDGPHRLTDAPKLVGRIDLEIISLPDEHEDFAIALRHLVHAARSLRRMTLITCQSCGKQIYPEHQYNAVTCYSCVLLKYGVVF